MAISDKQRRFVAEYIVDLNATQAASRTGYSKKTAYAQGQRLLKNAEIQSAIADAKKARSENTGIDAARVLQELSRLGFSDIRKAFNDDGHLLAPSEWDDEFAASVASIEVVTKTLPGQADDELDAQPHGGALARKRNAKVEYIHKIKVWDKNSALEKLAKHLGMFIDRVEQTTTHEAGNSVAALMDRIAEHGKRIGRT